MPTPTTRRECETWNWLAMKAPADRPETEADSVLAPSAGSGTPCEPLWAKPAPLELARAARAAIEPLRNSAGHRTARPSLWHSTRESIAILYGEALAMSSALGWYSPQATSGQALFKPREWCVPCYSPRSGSRGPILHGG